MKRKIIALTAFLLLLFFYKANSQEYKRMMNDSNANFYDIQKSFYKYWAEKEKQMKKVGESDKEDEKDEEEREGFEGEYYQFKRWEWYVEPRVYPSGKMINFAAKTFEAWQKEKSESNSGRTTSIGGTWSPVGPYNYQAGASWNPGLGRINCIAFDPSNPLIIYVGCPAGGLWKSTDGGSIWHPLSDNIPSLGVSGIAINYNNPNQVFILTGDGDGWHTSSVGVLRSDDGGQTWNTTNFSFGTEGGPRGYKLLMDPVDPAIMFAIDIFGVYRTTDGWATSTLVLGSGFFDIEFKPGDRNTVYAATANDLLKSTAGGVEGSWDIIKYVSPSNRMAIGVTPANPNYVYLVSGSGNGFEGLFLSTNSGASFTTQSTAPNILGYSADGLDVGEKIKSQSLYDLTIGVDPINANTVYVGGINVWKSTNGGVNWAIKTYSRYPTSYPYIHGDQHAFEFRGSTIYAGTDGGIFRSTDGASSFTSLNATLQITQMYRIAGTPQNSNLFLYGAQDNGTSVLNLSPFSNLNIAGADGAQVRIDYTNSNKLYYSAQLGQLYKSADGGATYNNFKPPQKKGDGAWVTPFLMDQASPTTFYAGYDTIYKTTNSGASWSVVFYGSDLQYSMAIGTNNPNVVYTAMPHALYRTLNGGVSWFNITGTLPAGGSIFITSVAVSPVNSNVVCVSTSGYLDGNKLFYSNDGGANWVNISGGLLNIPVNCVAFEPGSPNDAIYIGTDLGVYYKNNDLPNCVPFKTGLPNVQVNDFYINTAANKIIAATFGRGAWMSDLHPSCPADYTLYATNSFAGTQIYTASNTIISIVTNTGGAGMNVTYQAANGTTLLPGFEFVSSGGAVFTVGTEGCTYNGREAGPLLGRNDSNIIFYQLKAPASTQNKTDVASGWLEQNVSNSSGSPAIINYHLPAVFSMAQIEIADMNWKILKTITLGSKRSGEITLPPGSLAAGSYIYSLVVDGKVIATYKMNILK